MLLLLSALAAMNIPEATDGLPNQPAKQRTAKLAKRRGKDFIIKQFEKGKLKSFRRKNGRLFFRFNMVAHFIFIFQVLFNYSVPLTAKSRMSR